MVWSVARRVDGERAKNYDMTPTRPKPPKVVGVNARGHRVGQDHPHAVLTDREVEIVFELREVGWGYRRIAAKLEVSKSLIRRIVKGEVRGQQVARFKRCT